MTLSLDYKKFIKKIPKDADKIIQFLNRIKNDILQNINPMENNMLNAMKHIINDKQLVEKFEFCRNKISKIRNDIKLDTIGAMYLESKKGKKVKIDKKTLRLSLLYYIFLSYSISLLNDKCRELDNLILFEKDNLIPNVKSIVEGIQKTEEIIGWRNELSIAEFDIKHSIKKFRKMFPNLKKELEKLGMEPIFIEEDTKKLSKQERKELIEDTILEMKDEVRDLSGGLISLSNLYLKMKDEMEVSSNDVEEAVNRLSKKGMIPGLIKQERGVKFVEFVPVKMTNDIKELINCVEEKGWINLEETIQKTDWSQDRILRTLEEMNELKIVRKVSDFSGGNRWYFPGIVELKEK